MALIHCPECRIEVSSKAPTCPKCAYPLSRLTTLPQAILKGDVELVEDVIKSGADVNERTKNENTPLFIAAATGDCRIIQSLLSAGASAQTRNDEGETPLDIARKKRRKQAIALLQEMLSEKANDRPRETQEEGIVRIIKKTPAGDKVIRDFQSTEKKVSAALSCTKCAQPIGGSDVTCPHCKILIVRRYCSSCKKLYPEHARGCPHCGASGEKRFRYYRHPEGYLTAGIALLIFSIAVAMNWAQPSEKPRPKAPSAIAQRLSANAHLQPRIYKVVPAKPRVESEHIEKTSEPTVPAENIAIDPEVKETGSKPSIPSEEPEVEPAAPPTQQEPQSDESYDESFTEPESEPSSDETVEPDVPIETDESEDAPQSDEPARLQVNKRGRALNDLGYRLMRSGQPEHAIPILQERLKLGDQRQVVLAELEAAKRDLVSAEVQPSMQ